MLLLIISIFPCSLYSQDWGWYGNWEHFIEYWQPRHEQSMDSISNMKTKRELEEHIKGLEEWLNGQTLLFAELARRLKEDAENSAYHQGEIRIEKYKRDTYMKQISFCKQMMALIGQDLGRHGRTKEEYIKFLVAESKKALKQLDDDRQYVTNFMKSRKKYVPKEHTGFISWMKNKAYSFMTGVDYEELEFRMKEFQISSKNQTSIILYTTLLNWGGTISDIGKPEYLKALPDTSEITGIAAKQAILFAASKQFAEDPDYPLEQVMKARSYVKSSLKLK